MRVRFGRIDEVPLLRELESAADKRFLGVSMDNVAARQPPSVDFLESALGESRLWVADLGDSSPAGYAVVVFVDQDPHLQIVTVHPSHQGRGIARAMINEIADWARQEGAARVTLTTFRDVAWNRPLYERLGFVVIDDAELSDGLRVIRDEEIARGLDEDGPRVTMALDLE